MRGYPERTLATRAKWLLDTREDVEVSATEWVEEMEEILKELANAPEPSPFVWWSDADDVVFESLRNGKHLPFDQRNAYLSAVEISSALPLYTAPPAPSVPDADLVREAAPDIWRIMCGDWREETVAIHNSEGWIADGLDLKKAAALVKAHNGSLGLGIDAAIAAEKGGAAFRTMIEKGQS